jgi:hypothetical protein
LTPRRLAIDSNESEILNSYIHESIKIVRPEVFEIVNAPF